MPNEVDLYRTDRIEWNAIGGSYSDTNHVDDPVGFYAVDVELSD